MGRPLRTFVALRLGEEAAGRLHARARQLARDDPALVAPAREDMHLTVAFLGDTEVEEVHRIAAALRRAAAGAGPFGVAFHGSF